MNSGLAPWVLIMLVHDSSQRFPELLLCAVVGLKAVKKIGQ